MYRQPKINVLSTLNFFYESTLTNWCWIYVDITFTDVISTYINVESTLSICWVFDLNVNLTPCSTLKIPLIKRSAPVLFIDTLVVNATLLSTVKLTAIFPLELRRVCIISFISFHSSDHLLQWCNYNIDFDNVDILATDVGKCNLLENESFLMKCDNPVLNRTTKSFSLELFEYSLYHSFLILYQILLLLYPSDWYWNFCINILDWQLYILQ